MRKKRRMRRGKRRKLQKKKNVKIKIYQNNIRGLACKQDCLENILENNANPDIVLLNDTATRGKRKIKIKVI